VRTVQEIYDEAIRLMDAQNESNGNTNTADNKEYMFRTPDCLNRYINLVYPYSDTYEPRTDGKRTVHPKLQAMTDEVNMDDLICFSVLAPALVYELLLEENPSVASARYKDYESALLMARSTRTSVEEAVEMPYGGIEYGEFSRW
jgi:hypothetical protein